MLLKKKKSRSQIAHLETLKSRLQGLDAELLQCGEPMLSMRASSLLTDIQVARENSEPYSLGDRNG